MPTTPGQDFLCLLPVTIPLLGIVSMAVVGSRVPPRLRNLIVAGAAAGSLVSIVLLWTQEPWSVTVTTLAFEGVSPALAPTLHFAPGPWSALVGLLMTVVTILASLATPGYQVPRASAELSLLALAGALGACVSANLFTIVVSWGLVDLALLGFNSWHALDRSEMAGASWRAALAYLAGFGLWSAMLMQTLSGGDVLNPTSRLIVTAAALVRLGIYPLPYPTWPGKRQPIAGTIILQTASMACGAQLLARLAPGGLPMADKAITVITVALLLTAILAWQARETHRALHYVAANQAASIALAFYLAPQGGMLAAPLLLANVALCLSCIAADSRYLPCRTGLRDLAAPFVALASLAAFPATVGFAARRNLTTIALTRGFHGVVLISTVANALIVAPLLRRAHFLWQQPREEGRIPSWASRIALVVPMGLAILIVWLGLYPHSLDRFTTWGSPMATGTASAAQAMPLTLPMLLITVVLPAVGGYLAHRLWLLIPSRPTSVATVIVEALDLGWVHTVLQWLTRKVRSILRIGATFTEQGLYLAWTLAWALVLLFWLFGKV